MLGAMLGSDAATVCLPEAQFIAQLITDKHPLDAADIRALVDKIAAHPRYKVWNARIDAADMLHLAGAGGYAEFIDAFAAAYGRSVGKPAARRWVDHSPINIRNAGRLAAAFPNAKFIHIFRDGRAVANSLMPLDWGPNNIIDAARHWQASLSIGFGLSAVLPSDRLLHVKYEDLVQDGAATMRRVAASVGIAYSDELLDTGGLKVPHYTRVNHRLVGAAVDPTRIDAWRDRLPAREIEVFEYMAGGLLTHLGYALVNDRGPKAPSRSERLRWRLLDAYKRQVNARRWRTRVGGAQNAQSA